ncbi:triose-phosphate isomerase [Natronolimnohabitans innermongolicus]|uniref:Triosephosphate isomerase n=1 Tax=Natronolimnohabitans innermongolicus JCM 12255 TaxID=1227499 RepID=L9WSX9_9EURY|nr:triose-phosphate isomerase [Natronolimnohabitans innermongolicus]ELY52522.1 triosephosphate isomerase [Natronolimnohabitans innermongolicus JCM 12255]
MALEYPYFLVNYKTATETVGEDGVAFTRTIDRVARETETRFAVAPQPTDIRLVASTTDLPIVAQFATRREDAALGTPTLEAVAAAGADAVFVNHPQNEATFADVPRLLERCSELGLESIVCVNSREQTRAALTYDPDCLLFERPADIASEAGLIRTHPERIASFVETVEAAAPATRTFVGGGVRTADDVERAFDCGVDATGAASAALEADDREAWLRSIANAVPGALE